MALESGITLYDQIKRKLKGGGVEKKAGFFDFGTVSLGKAPETTFEKPTYGLMDSSVTPSGMVMEQIPGGLAGEIDYTKGISPTGFYKDIDVTVEMPTATTTSAATTTQKRTEVYDDAQAAAMLGLAPPQSAEDYANLDQIMSNLGYTGAFEYGRSKGPVGSAGFTKTTEAGRQAQSFVSMLAGPVGIVADVMFGDQYVGLGGLQESAPYGVAGLITEKRQREVYDIAKQEARNIPGFDAYVGKDGTLKGIKPATGLAKFMGQEYSVIGGAGSIDDARNEIAISKGYDPDTYDFATKSGTELDGFVTGFGGFSSDGSFVNMKGERSSSMNHGYKGMQYASAVADVYGVEKAASLMREQANRINAEGGFFSSSRAQYYSNVADRIEAGEREDYAFGSGKDKYTGGFVRSTSGQPVKTGSGGFAYSGKKVERPTRDSGPSQPDTTTTGPVETTPTEDYTDFGLE